MRAGGLRGSGKLKSPKTYLLGPHAWRSAFLGGSISNCNDAGCMSCPVHPGKSKSWLGMYCTCLVGTLPAWEQQSFLWVFKRAYLPS